ncbi:16S rRNA (cytosine(1402)-N(4))-methyltransferase [Candidatus Nomurabacteria bacterium RIFCSPHIGHO2_02_FULL_41_18]|uniref:Ribosomal RNA small subunit methyltransferase H n=1 Tax=Candidatus Nomurabacteria bacterium RIFCSPHIGHO2_02_FULL_41_18 TaxID=1801754 RepID=A0A1F6W7X8_9BACT|nr:MAG: 16S rRNA (cytosine(1402)-N(4))-methyltransferase [Candidatus Nomurabacteria bacterium RIFCSPHIGHO2_01_FULL_41_71]OGI77944.1 MAG: 16S rRNA (cytosine(1402)-N(4))-methyltransferase [Candidatus Nomurabacteria bacterium RIFCSPHIGHO2_02_FULL_41_18]OGI89564.1 MAG: 16S rRNA (cytosine(1402)-N(4))-methyltransferase [Candidatus Nomurabacteria bacterium RIFCSPLOWO2_01_FULL_41_52b]
MEMHKTVLLNETIDGLDLKEDSVVLDATFGGGGHSAEILKRFPEVKIIALDQDASVWKSQPGISFHNKNFRNLDEVLKKEGKEKVDGIIFDLGLSSDQLENSGRGFSFMKDEPLFMTMKENPRPEDLTAREIVNDWDEQNLADIIYGFGEERYGRRIAGAIAQARKQKPIETTFDLVGIIKRAVPARYREGRLHFATKTFQAIRIAVNDELEALREGLKVGFESLRSGGRMAVISFHSLEDRITKRFFKDKQKAGEAILINKKPIVAKREEIKNNPRSRSAKLRIIQKQ